MSRRALNEASILTKSSMKIFKLALLILVGCVGIEVQAQERIPQFREYPVAATYTGKNAAVILKTKDDRMFRTKLTEAARREKPNFAGHYIVTYWGCGSSCVMGAAIDAKTGSSTGGISPFAVGLVRSMTSLNRLKCV